MRAREVFRLYLNPPSCPSSALAPQARHSSSYSKLPRLPNPTPTTMVLNEVYFDCFDNAFYLDQAGMPQQVGDGSYGDLNPVTTLPMDAHYIAGQAQLNPLPPEEYSVVNIPYQHAQAVGYVAPPQAVSYMDEVPSINTSQTYMPEGHYPTYVHPQTQYQETSGNMQQSQPPSSPASGFHLPQNPSSNNDLEPNNLVCNVCQKEFTRKWNRDKHIDEVHKDIRPFQCPHCSTRPYKRNHDLKNHIEKKHSSASN
ncbi:hypothetical protein C8Q73DRAFT_679146 [Cubamyces lactineus]|nr:hypothetical protein C8Q73DRAFT_679146 [Cubamyces lactineus]